MIKLKSLTPYWEEFKKYQSFESVKDMNNAVKQFVKAYTLTDAEKAVLNTIKLHAKNYVGVCWLYREQIAKKAKISLSSVDRAIRSLKEIGLFTVHSQIHTKRGGQTHNVYVINDVVDNLVPDEYKEANKEPQEAPQTAREDQSADSCEVDTDEPSEVVEEPSSPSASRDLSDQVEPHKNLNRDLEKNLKKDLSIYIDPNTDQDDPSVLKHVPSDFIDIMHPFYGHAPEVIAARWKTVCVAIKKTCFKFENTSWDSIKDSWKTVVQQYKRKKVKNKTDDGLGGYFYAVLCDNLAADYHENVLTPYWNSQEFALAWK